MDDFADRMDQLAAEGRRAAESDAAKSSAFDARLGEQLEAMQVTLENAARYLTSRGIPAPRQYHNGREDLWVWPLIYNVQDVVMSKQQKENWHCLAVDTLGRCHFRGEVFFLRDTRIVHTGPTYLNIGIYVGQTDLGFAIRKYGRIDATDYFSGPGEFDKKVERALVEYVNTHQL